MERQRGEESYGSTSTQRPRRKSQSTQSKQLPSTFGVATEQLSNAALGFQSVATFSPSPYNRHYLFYCPRTSQLPKNVIFSLPYYSLQGKKMLSFSFLLKETFYRSCRIPRKTRLKRWARIIVRNHWSSKLTVM